MKSTLAKGGLAVLAGLLLTGPALAQTATATTHLHIRSGPGPHFAPVGSISSGAPATIEGCLPDGSWCKVSYNGTSGWSYADYLVFETQTGAAVRAHERPPELVGIATYEGPASAGVPGDELIGPVDSTRIVVPPEPAVVYAQQHPVEQVYLETDIAVGATLPANVALSPIPNYAYQYVYINGVPVLVRPDNRQIVYVVR
ncbi:DUF1236 domain-containing protein [Pelagibacterium xiamenense]|uniref:DUF1236 domain-containing protein n=1 Tax=Pelagibacterium xiamenense TaxID=2901140 RepID=UPI001E5BB844|nr:DUF1236 domain-containing protein [Pelagibacterium xiamenense]MCD7059674.1 DUF1236 domain-containing protein [Pelagibacterium xiamenense]